MAECLKDITLQTLWQYEISEQEEEEYINDQVVPLNHMVRDSYLKYLKQVISKNLNMCSDSSNIYAQHDIEKCAGLLELKALRLCMVTSLYQKVMLQMVTDIKQHTKESKLYRKFDEFVSQNCLCKVSKCKATQTNILELKVEDCENICEDKVKHIIIKTEPPDDKGPNHISPNHVDMSCHTTFSPDTNFSVSSLTENSTSISTNFPPHCVSNQFQEPQNGDSFTNTNEYRADEVVESSDNSIKRLQGKADTILSDSYTQSELKVTTNETICNLNAGTENIGENNNCSLKTSAEDDEEAIKQLTSFLADDTSKSGFGEAFLYETATQELIRILESEGEFSEGNESNDKTMKDTLPQARADESEDSFWKTQKHLQKKHLHECISKMCCNSDAKVKMKNKFFNLFGFDSDEDDVWCSKEKIAQYKQRIAPFVVKHLLPYYKQKRILGRGVFKRVASHVTDKLVSFKHFPEEADVEKGILLFFSYHGFIGKFEDVWSDWDRELH